MSRKIDLTGRRIGKLTVIERTDNPNAKTKKTYWRCLCDCGNESIVDTTSLNTNRIKQCWECAHYAANLHKRKDYSGQRFGKLVVLQMIYPDRQHKRNNTRVICKCDCGRTITRDIDKLLKSQKDGYVASCGCRRIELGQQQTIDIIGTKYGRLLPVYYVSQGMKLKAMCKCDCGNMKIIAKSDILSGHTLSCGCLQKERISIANQVDHTGQVSEYGVKLLRQSYQNNRNVWVWECECGICKQHFYEVPARVLNGHIRHCPNCTSRSGIEDYIESILKDCDIKYQREKRFIDCRNIYPLPFDFVILNNDNTVKFLLEYDGRQHYEPIDFFGGEEAFKVRKLNDAIKNEYCKTHNISLIRLPYYLSGDEIKERLIDII